MSAFGGWQNWTREPLVHFLLAGGLLFALFAWRGDPVDPASRVIAVDRAVQAQLALRFKRTMARAPTDAELDAQIQRFVRDEILYREGLRLGLDQGDAVVRQRVVTKMDMTATASAEAAKPDDATLRSYYDANEARYAGDQSLSFDQLYFSDEADARTVSSKLSSRQDCLDMGEAISLPISLEEVVRRDLQSRFGEAFAREVMLLDASQEWQGPIQSGFGWHLIRLREKTDGEAADFDAIREQVENDWRSDEIAARKERAFAILRDAYRVEIHR